MFFPLLILFSGICTGNTFQQDSLLNVKPCNHAAEIVTTYEDSLIFDNLVATFRNKEMSLNEYIISIAHFFIGTPYVSSTLEIDGEEWLVVNLREVDCITFVEYVAALSLCFAKKQYDFNNFTEMLMFLRYQSGKIDGYQSRLHYFSDWLIDNQNKGIVEIVSNRIGNATFDNKVNFMTSNAHLYRQLSDSTIIEQLKTVETRISSYSMKYITKDNIKNIENEINNGDIIAFATSIKGLDISHIGFAIFKNGQLFLLHASSENKKVEISALSLSDYLEKRKNITGILAGRVSVR